MKIAAQDTPKRLVRFVIPFIRPVIVPSIITENVLIVAYAKSIIILTAKPIANTIGLILSVLAVIVQNLIMIMIIVETVVWMIVIIFKALPGTPSR